MEGTYMFAELSESELFSIEGGDWLDTLKDAVVGAVAGAVTGFVKGFVVGVGVGLTAGPAGIIAGAISCGTYYAGKGAVIGAATNATIREAQRVIN